MFGISNKLTIFILLSAIYCTHTLAQTTSYPAGFKSERITDSSRTYKPNTDKTDNLHYRPVDIDIWYPAQPAREAIPLLFKDFLDLFGRRATFYTASHAGDSLADILGKSFCEQFKCATPQHLFEFRTASYRDAEPATGRYPVIIYMSSYNGMGYENYKLFEELANKGFVVVSIISIGRYPGDMTMKNEDMMEQVYDAVAALKYLKNRPNIDFTRTAILGYSWGGVSGAVLSTMVPNVHCLVSFDGSEFHHYKQDKNDDADFEGVKNSAAFKSMKIAVPYLRLESSPLIKDSKPDSVYNFRENLSGKYLILKIAQAEHTDFCAIPVTVRLSGGCVDPQLYSTITALTESYLGDHLTNTQSFSRTLKVIGKRVANVKTSAQTR